MYKSFIFKKEDMADWAVLVLPFGEVKYGFTDKEKATRWSNRCDYFLNHLKNIVKEK